MITKILAHASGDQIRSLWCDGVLLPDLKKENIRNAKQIETIAFIGNDGQDRYELVLELGDKSIDKYISGLDMKDCIPSPSDNDCYEIDIASKRMLIYLR